MGHPRADEFTSRIGTVFQVSDSQVELTLISVEPGRSGSMSLTYHSDSPTLLSQGMYELANEGSAEPIFLVPISADDNGVEYEAIFA